MKRTLFQSVLLVVLICSIPVRGQIPQTLSYQGVLTDANGVIVPDGKYTLTFKLFDADEGGKAIWSENQKVFIQNGLFNVALGSVSPLDIPFDKPFWLATAVGEGSDTGQRMELTATPYSLFARTVADGAITGRKIANNQVVRSINSIKDNVRLTAGANVKITQNGSELIISMLEDRTTLASSSNFWKLTGNFGTLPGEHFVGTKDKKPLVFRTNRAIRMVIRETGDVGIGTINPGAKLEIAGDIKIVDGTQGAGKVLTSDATGWASWQTAVGTPGPTGPVGPPGATGANGPAGANGATGPAGATGASGPPGPTGAVGANGSTGPAGATGATGAVGANGATGVAGANGATGAAGPAGATGPTGAAGASGATGATGPIGGSDGEIIYNNSGVADGSDIFYDDTNNRVGIGTTTPSSKFHVVGQIRASSFSSANGTSGGPAFRFESDTNTGTFRPAADNYAITTGGSERLRIDANGNVGIGTTSPASKLEVSGGDIQVTGGSFIDDGTTLNVPDYVFEMDYKLESIEEHAEYMWQEKHLPAVKSSKEINDSNGYNMAERREQILEELEKAHVYIAQLHDTIKELTAEDSTTQAKLSKTESELNRVKSQMAEFDALKARMAKIEAALQKMELSTAKNESGAKSAATATAKASAGSE